MSSARWGVMTVRLASLLALLLLLPAQAVAADRHGSDQPGRFDYYVLVLSWSPTYCAHEGDRRNDRQCEARRQHGFTLHGLWPQYLDGWPQECWRGGRPWVPDHVIDRMRDIMPSKNLIIHEYREHGTCAGLSPADYYKAARTLFERIDIPKQLETPDDPLSLSPEKIERAFLANNAWLRPEMISITCRKGALLDIRVCFERDLSPRVCGKNEASRECRVPSVAIPAAD